MPDDTHDLVRRLEELREYFVAHGRNLMACHIDEALSHIRAQAAAITAFEAILASRNAAIAALEAKLDDPCLVKREAGEPMFVLLGRDSAAPGTMEEWCRKRANEIDLGIRPATQQESGHIAEVLAKAETFIEWRRANRPFPPAPDAEGG